MTFRPYFILMRPANLVTAMADIIAGAAISGFALNILSTHTLIPLLYLIIATICLYGGGVVLNDVFDLETDRIERPERPLPSKQVSVKNAALLAISLYLIGIVLSYLTSPISGLIACVIALAATIYDKWAKHHVLFGPVTMGICRGLNLLLGISYVWEGLVAYWPLAGLPIIFIGAITLTSQGEVIGNNKRAVLLALLMDGIVAVILCYLAASGTMQWLPLLPFLVLWWGINLGAKLKAYRLNEPKYIMKAVKMGVLSLIPLNACYAAGFSSWLMALVILSLLPISLFLAKRFAVT